MKKIFVTLGMAFALAIGGTVLSVTPYAPAPQAAQAATYSSCFTAMNGERWCFRANCNWWEYTFHGCRDGWVRTNVWYASTRLVNPEQLTSA